MSDGPVRLLLKALHVRTGVFLEQLRRCNEAFSEPAVHDLRVATRRLIAALDMLMTVSSIAELRKTRVQLKRLLKSVGPLRDTQVQAIAVERLLPRFPELRSFATVLLVREQQSLKRISRRLGKLQGIVLQRRIAAGIRNLGRSLRRPGATAAINLALHGSLAASFTRVVEKREQVAKGKPETIHPLRIAFKKFRYASEILRPTIDRKLHKAMDAYQTGMGEAHDLEVLRAQIGAFVLRYARATVPAPPRAVRPPTRGGLPRPHPVSAFPPPSLAGLRKVRYTLQRRHTLQVKKFISSINRVHKFYVPTSGHP